MQPYPLKTTTMVLKCAPPLSPSCLLTHLFDSRWRLLVQPQAAQQTSLKHPQHTPTHPNIIPFIPPQPHPPFASSTSTSGECPKGRRPLALVRQALHRSQRRWRSYRWSWSRNQLWGRIRRKPTGGRAGWLAGWLAAGRLATNYGTGECGCLY